jgi:hypothetical protein
MRKSGPTWHRCSAWALIHVKAGRPRSLDRVPATSDRCQSDRWSKAIVKIRQEGTCSPFRWTDSAICLIWHPRSVPLVENEDVEAAGDEAIGNLDEALGEDPAYQELLGTLEALTPDEVYQLLALALLARHGSAPEEWQAMVTQARTTPRG